MKKIKIFFVLLGLIISVNSYCQDSIHDTHRAISYLGFVNSVPDHFYFPLIGFINLANGSHQSAQIGFVNWNENNFKGAQIGFVNTAGGFVNGTQIGFINTCGSDFKGSQIGFVNTTMGKINGVQIGFVNSTKQGVKGIQVGFINTCADSLKGGQVGFVNTAVKGVNGTQVGFVNSTKKTLKGFQLGFVNYADTISGGIPFGFLSFIKKGGYKAIEMGCTEMYPVNLSLKTGIRKFYTSLIASCNPGVDNAFSLGAGLGSIVPIGKSFYFNPELVTQSSLTNNNYQLANITSNFGFTITKKIDVLTGPSLVWNYSDPGSESNKPFYSIYNNGLHNRNNLIVGFRLALRYNCF